ncbi:MAG: hypothetical protein KatS3mg131_3073 [Candidatus Tectimicrobiota bacterium]|nr:MAG: hypothetical protein KatS3mg131_3073 [Candidatus Tectomicrobia bacterium]
MARCLEFLHVLTGSVGTRGGTSPNSWDKFVPAPPLKPPPQQVWNELLWPREYPLAHHEMSFLLPHFLKEGRGRLDTYFTRVYNPVWTNPDGATWIEVLRDEEKIGLHCRPHPGVERDRLVCRLRLAHGHGRRAPRPDEPGDAGWQLDRLSPAGAARGAREAGAASALDVRSQPRRGLGGGRVLDRALLAHRPRRQPGGAPVLRVALPPGGKADRGGVLPLDLRAQRARAAGGGGGRRADAPRVHAQVWRL